MLQGLFFLAGLMLAAGTAGASDLNVIGLSQIAGQLALALLLFVIGSWLPEKKTRKKKRHGMIGNRSASASRQHIK